MSALRKLAAVGALVALAASPAPRPLPAGYVCQAQTPTVSVCRSHAGADLLVIDGVVRPYSQLALREAMQ